MTAVHCPMCELSFRSRTERDWHLRNEHRHHELRRAPVAASESEETAPPPTHPEPPRQ